jgi:uncharacterized protein YraI
MKHSNFLAASAFVAALALPGYAVAQSATATADVNMRAGPGTRFPVVTTIPQDRNVTLHGCEQNFNWCDVSWRNNRGWVFADYLDVRWRGMDRSVSEVGPRIDLPIIGFTVGDYWGRFYQDRPWFDQQQRWQQAGRGVPGPQPDWRDRMMDGDWQQQEQRRPETVDTDRRGVATGPGQQPTFRDRMMDGDWQQQEQRRPETLDLDRTGTVRGPGQQPTWRDRMMDGDWQQQEQRRPETVW